MVVEAQKVLVDFPVVFSEIWPQLVHTIGSFAQFGDDSGNHHLAESGIGEVKEHFPGPVVRIVNNLCCRIDGSGR